MTDQKEQSGKTLHAGHPPRAPLGVKRPGTETGTVKQSFSHGRANTVVVEKKRTVVRPGTPTPAPVAPKPVAVAPAAPAPTAAARSPQPSRPPVSPPPSPSRPPPPSAQRSGMVLRTLTEEEKAARAKALGNARIAEAEARARAEEDQRRRAAEDARLKKEAEAAAKRKAEEDARHAAEEEARRRAEVEAARRAELENRPTIPVAPTPGPTKLTQAAFDDENTKRKASTMTGMRRPGGGPVRPPPAPARPAKPGGGGDKRRDGRLTVTAAASTDGEERQRSLAAMRRQTQRRLHQGASRNDQNAAVAPRDIVIPEAITVQELANRMARRAVDVIKVLMKNGVMATINTSLDTDTAQLIAEEYGHVVKRVAESDVLEGLKGPQDDEDKLQPRAPVVTIMGHVDHGKTSLLDAMRQTNVVAGEAGGITQHIGAYQITTAGGDKITFLDTPGHAAFTAMRARGAKVTDIVVLVVAADDGVMPQTEEAIAHAKAAGVPIIVAINKVDKPDANPSRVKTELLRYEVVVEDMGGETIAVEVSALAKTGLDKLQEAILLQAEVLELKANPDRAAEGAIVEAKLDKGRGPVATVLVQNGTIRVGDIVVAGGEWGRVRALVGDDGKQVQAAGPSLPVEVLGLQGTPEAGDELVVVESDARAREIADFRTRKRREARTGTSGRATMEDLLKDRKDGEKKILPVVIKGDVQGSVEAISQALKGLGNDEVQVQVLQSGTGGVTESDVVLAHASGAVVIAFNVRAHAEGRERAKRDGVDIRYYSIIYNIIDDVKAAMSGLLSPVVRENFLGNATILQVFNITKTGKVAGCRVVEGTVRRGAKVRLIRDKVVIHEGRLSTLRRFKEEVREVQQGYECGMAFENYQDMREGDTIECFELEEVARTL
ncbi:MAG: translation initiation factor IF-2 [Alphaproteobacteria bacterium]|nr:translation initiation factor IF-2 [Alphaproteobacteria bacterium]